MYKIIWTLYLFLLAYLSLVSADSILLQNDILIFSHADKVKHLLAYSLLGLLSIKANFTIRYSFIFSVIIGCILEVFQLLFTNRQFDWIDIIANTMGVSIVCFFYYRRKLSNSQKIA